jgi:hypothetical protein
MTTEDIEAKISDIFRAAAIQDNFELAHSLEDRLRRDVLRAIANGADNAADLARAALRSSQIRFERRTA